MITLRQGDCLELMKDIPDGSVDMVLADPPYGIDFQSRRPQDKQNIKPKSLTIQSRLLTLFRCLNALLVRLAVL